MQYTGSVIFLRDVSPGFFSLLWQVFIIIIIILILIMHPFSRSTPVHGRGPERFLVSQQIYIFEFISMWGHHPHTWVVTLRSIDYGLFIQYEFCEEPEWRYACWGTSLYPHLWPHQENYHMFPSTLPITSASSTVHNLKGGDGNRPICLLTAIQLWILLSNSS
ncbi:hypothetical protein BKA82DRAFT_4203356 [Pisolithus tinctorius]|nr:hypothetical protein BKA82DRAFT_4203356 [Pisolithus tinctorius]